MGGDNYRAGSGKGSGGEGKAALPMEGAPFGKGGKGKKGPGKGKAKSGEKAEKKAKVRWGPGLCKLCGCTYISAGHSPTGHGYCLCKCEEYGGKECPRTKAQKEWKYDWRGHELHEAEAEVHRAHDVYSEGAEEYAEEAEEEDPA